jgi:hypothetical protein
LNDSDHTLESSRKRVITAFDFAIALSEKFKMGTRDQKQEIVFTIGSNPFILNGKIRLNPFLHYQILSEQENWKEKYKDRLEPLKYADAWTKRPDLIPANPIWLPALEQIRNAVLSYL